MNKSKRRYLYLNHNCFTIYSPRSSESIRPFVNVDAKFKFGFFLQLQSPFGLYIRLPFFWMRWGSA